MKKTIFLFFCVLSTLYSVDEYIEIDGNLVSTSELILKLKSDSAPLLGVENPRTLIDIDGIDEILTTYGLSDVNVTPLFNGYQSFIDKHWKHDLHRYYILSFEPTNSLDLIANDIGYLPTIELVEYNSIYQSTTNDPAFGHQWEHLNEGQWGGDVDCDMDTDLAWEDPAWDNGDGTYSVGSPDVIIAIIDNFGINDEVFDIESNYDPDMNYNGQYKIVHATNIADCENELEIDQHHGVSVASIAGAVGNNEYGIAGVCWGCKIMPINIAEG